MIVVKQSGSETLYMVLHGAQDGVIQHRPEGFRVAVFKGSKLCEVATTKTLAEATQSLRGYWGVPEETVE